ncbi:insulinase family protein [Alicyclobacillus fastidiosus]|uniref:Insulinase family protein n=1 Tax=Alicyclobacillus fastidiosus TaxID=392011 RepID=A0ABY6ZD68_9BACL|nr:pitrilysin family protein [Alicyclobacillus fastidiosus]WAH40787.1 insulinase family protein [Alicyclobacillus fastidiosus]GMA62264.1 peptidase M16 [Alicyclobacillus fastidiosus]
MTDPLVNHAEASQMQVIERTLDNGLTVCLIPKADFQQTFAMFATKYGSIDNEFELDGKPVRVPDGIAHFLEHKMFEDDEQEVFSQFAEHGASVNAFTTFDETAYYFSGTSDLRENIDTLLNFVQKIYLTDENVEKEKGIIAQEIRMGDDNPDRRVFMDLLSAMYAAHPVRIDIAGSVESIYQIDRETLLKCYHTFYHPSNMMLVIAGGFDPEQVMGWVVENQARKNFPDPVEIKRKYPVEPKAPKTDVSTTVLPVSLSRCLIGWKDTVDGLAKGELLRRELLTGLVLDALFGKTTAFYGELLRDGLIDKAFSWEYELTDQYGYTVVGGNAPRPTELVARVKAHVRDAVSRGIADEDFQRARKKAIGRFLMSLDQVSYVARSYLTYRLRNADFLQTIEVLQGLQLADANERLKEHLSEEQMVVSTVLPKAEAAS